MKKRFKLIKEYPGSPVLGTEIIKSFITVYCKKNNLFYNKNTFMNKGDESFELEQPSNFPEFWEKVVEKDYEILSVINPLQNNGEIQENLKNGYSFEYKLNKFPHLIIKSVKRLSDGEVFTIGDVDNFGAITGFVIREDKIVSQYYRIGDWQWLSSIQHIKKPLLTTRDGVDIFIGDKYWTLNTKVDNWVFESETGRDNINYFYKNKDYAEKTGVYYFSTQKAAKNHIKCNKICLNYNDVLKILDECYFSEDQRKIFKSELTKLVKKRI